MEKLLKNTILFCSLVSISLNLCVGQVSNFKNLDEINFKDERIAADYLRFLESQKSPLLTAKGESFNLNGTVWMRLYGENEYYLALSIPDISKFHKRIQGLDDHKKGIIKSNLHYIIIELTKKSKSLLTEMNLIIPEYVQNNIITILPEIDIDVLKENDVNFSLLNSYGKKDNGQILRNQSNKATLWIEGFEGATTWSTSVYGSACGWGKVYKNSPVACGPFVYSGNYSMWCATTGTACENTDCSDYVDNMDCAVYNNVINDIRCYNNVSFDFYMLYETYNINDYVQLFFRNVPGGNWIGPQQTWYGQGALGWFNWQYDISGTWDYFGYIYSFVSNGTWAAQEGVYLDNLRLTANQTTPPPISCGNWSSCNDCSQSQPCTTYTWSSNFPCYTSSISYPTQACPTPPPPTTWSACNNSQQTRTVYTCTGDGTWSSTIEGQCCLPLPGVIYGPWSLWSNCQRSRSVTSYSLGTYPNCVVPYTSTEYEYGTPPSVSVSTTPTTCNLSNGSATANPSGGTSPYSYYWSNGENTQTISNKPSGSYYVTVTDSKGCTGTGSAQITNNGTNPSASASNTGAYCEQNTIQLNSLPNGMTSYSWSGPGGFSSTQQNATRSNATTAMGGTYSVTVTNSSGCTGTATTLVTVNPAPSANASTTQHNTLCGSCNGIVTASGGSSYAWSNGCNLQTCNNACAGTHTVTVTSASSCTATAQTTVNNNSGGPTSLNPSSTSANAPNCDGSASVNPSGGTPPYTYTWNNSCSSSNSCSNLCASTYYVTVTDNNSCSITGSVTVNTISVEEISFIRGLSIYPNPTTGELNIVFEQSKSEKLTLKLIDITGREIWNGSSADKFTGKYSKVINMKKYGIGVYTLQIITSEGTINRKVVVE